MYFAILAFDSVMVNSTGTNDSNTDLSQRTRLLEERLVDPRSPICVDSLLDGIVALIYDSEGLKKTKNFDGFFSRCKWKRRMIRVELSRRISSSCINTRDSRETNPIERFSNDQNSRTRRVRHRRFSSTKTNGTSLCNEKFE